MSTVMDKAELEQRLAELLRQEEELVFPEFGPALAVELGMSVYREAARLGKAVTVDITQNGHCLFHLAMEGTSPDNVNWIRRKNNVVNRFGRSSYYIGTKLRAAGKTIEEVYQIPAADFASHGGAFPIRVRHAGLIGTLTVSGLPQKEDHELAVTVLRAFLAEQVTR